jgi:hypothetical protein
MARVPCRLFQIPDIVGLSSTGVQVLAQHTHTCALKAPYTLASPAGVQDLRREDFLPGLSGKSGS